METVPEYSTRVWTCRGWRVPYSSSYRMIPSEQGFDLHGLGREGSLFTATGTSVRESDESNTAGQLGGGAASLSGADVVVRVIPILLQIRSHIILYRVPYRYCTIPNSSACYHTVPGYSLILKHLVIRLPELLRTPAPRLVKHRCVRRERVGRPRRERVGCRAGGRGAFGQRVVSLERDAHRIVVRGHARDERLHVILHDHIPLGRCTEHRVGPQQVIAVAAHLGLSQALLALHFRAGAVDKIVILQCTASRLLILIVLIIAVHTPRTKFIDAVQ